MPRPSIASHSEPPDRTGVQPVRRCDTTVVAHAPPLYTTKRFRRTEPPMQTNVQAERRPRGPESQDSPSTRPDARLALPALQPPPGECQVLAANLRSVVGRNCASPSNRRRRRQPCGSTPPSATLRHGPAGTTALQSCRNGQTCCRRPGTGSPPAGGHLREEQAGRRWHGPDQQEHQPHQ